MDSQAKTGWADAKMVPIIGHVSEGEEDVGAVDFSAGEILNAESEKQYSEQDYRMLCREAVRWAVKGTKDGAYLRLLVLALFFCPDQWGNPSQRNMAATHRVLVASLNRAVRDFEKQFGIRLASCRSDEARESYRKATTAHHRRNKCNS